MSDVLDVTDGVYEMDSAWRGMVLVDSESTGLVAGAFPVRPPKTWFDDPKLPQLSPLTITADGRVAGHIAAWHTSHIGMAGGIKPPRSKSGYAYFRTGAIECDDGTFVDVGQITLAGGHAPLEASVREAVAHYDNTNSAVMDVAAGEDRHGIWVAGALRPSVTDEQVRAVRASSVSGDWRPINGRLELVAVCSVNCPGFPIPRARVAAGAPIALVAAGVEPLIEKVVSMRADQDIESGIKAGLATFRDRLLRLEDAILADSGGPSPAATEQAQELRMRVHGERLAREEAQIAELRSRVHGVTAQEVQEPEQDREAVITELRRRVRPEVAVDTEADTTWDDGLDIAVPIAAALRARVHGDGDAVPFDRAAPAAQEGLTAGFFHTAAKVFDEALHPRGHDGKFIEKDGFVSGFVTRNGYDTQVNRGRVLGFMPNPEDKAHPLVEVDLGNGRKGIGSSDRLTQVAAPVASLSHVPSDIDIAQKDWKAAQHKLEQINLQNPGSPEAQDAQRASWAAFDKYFKLRSKWLEDNKLKLVAV